MQSLFRELKSAAFCRLIAVVVFNHLFQQISQHLADGAIFTSGHDFAFFDEIFFDARGLKNPPHWWFLDFGEFF